jgi:hypothetical protein
MLSRRFQYIDAIIIDTPVLDEQVRRETQDVRRIQERLSRCEAFIGYLNGCSTYIQDSVSQRIWADSRQAILDDVSYIKTRL